MRKTVVSIIALCLCLFAGMALTACDQGETEKHTHTFSTEWSKDATCHWYVCEDDSCNEVSEKAEHTFEDRVCTVCGYAKEAVSFEVTESQFYAAIRFDGLTNFTADVSEKSPVWDDSFEKITGIESVTGKMYVDGNVTRFVFENAAEIVECFYEVAGGKIYVYTKIGETVYRTELTDSGDEGQSGSSFDEWKEQFASIDYGNFVYENGVYVGTVKADSDDAASVEVTLKFEDGKLVFAKFDESKLYGYESGSIDSIDRFYDYGTTTVTLPTEYTEIEIPGIPGEGDGWSSCFVFDNVTATRTGCFSIDGTEFETSETIYVDGEKWLVKANYPNVWDTVYFDGINTYVDGEVDGTKQDEGDLFFTGIIFGSFQTYFTERSDGTFYAKELALSESFVCREIVIVIADGKLVSVEYTVPFALGDETIDYRYSYTFEDWNGTTVTAPSVCLTSDLDVYFTFRDPNVSYRRTVCTEYGEKKESETSEFYLDGDKWKEVCGDGTVIFCDGETVRIDGDVSFGSFAYANGSLTELQEFFGFCKADLSYDDAKGTYVCNKEIEGRWIEATDADGKISQWKGVYTEIEVKIVSDALVYVTYKKIFTNKNNDVYTMTVTCEFSDWNSTSVTA